MASSSETQAPIKMESFSFARARTLSTSSTSSSDSESLVTPMTPRFAPSARAMALRAPCLKRNSSAPPTSSWRGITGLSTSLAPTPTLIAVEAVATPICSFAAPRSFSAAAPARSVRFNESPPEAGVTHSGKHYDRRPIQCTKRDSENDLSLQRCVTYGRDDEEFTDASGPEAANTAQAEARWACLKNGSVIASAVVRNDDGYPATTVVAAASTSAQAAPAQPWHLNNECSLPVHGVRSFGGLGARQGVESPQYTVQPPSPLKSMSSLPSDNGQVDAHATSQTHVTTHASGSSDALANLRSKSPNATPRQSPAVRIRWENVEGYFALSASETSDEDSAAPVEHVAQGIASPSTSTSTMATKPDSPPRLTSVLMERGGSSSDGSASCGSHCSTGSSTGIVSPRGRSTKAQRRPRGSARPPSSPLSEDAPSSSTVIFPAMSSFGAPDATLTPDASSATAPLEDTGSIVLVPAAPLASLSSVTLASLGLPSPSAHLSAASASAGSSGSFMLDTSPMSSRCSSTDPWSGVSSDETDGEAGNHPDSPTGGWGSSSCTSPDLAPADVATRLAQAQKQLVVVAQQPHTIHKLSASPPSLDPLTFASSADAVVPPSSMLPPALETCNTMLGVASSALRTRRAARAAAVAVEGHQVVSLDNSPLLAPYSSYATTDEEGAMGSSGANAVGTSPVGGAAAAAGVKTRRKCGTKRRSTRTSSSDGGGFYSSLDEGALGGF